MQDQQKCFTLEQPKDTPMFFHYQILDQGHEILFDLYYGSTPRADLHIGKAHVLNERSGYIDFVADNDGEFCYCLVQSAQYQQIPAKVAISIHYGFRSEHYQKLVEEHNYDAVNIQVHALNDVLTMTLNEVDYMKHSESEYHKQTESMNNAALWWPVVQVINFLKYLPLLPFNLCACNRLRY